MLKFLLTPKWIALTVITILLQPSFYLLSQWQWHRLHERQTLNSSILSNEQQQAITLEAALQGVQPQTSPTLSLDNSMQWRSVSITGKWDTEHQVLVRRQTYESNLGFWVVTPMRDTFGNVLLVNRGWIPASSSALSTPTVQSPPSDTVTMTGRIRIVKPRTNVKPQDLPARQVDQIQPLEVLQDKQLIGNAYAELITSNPESRTSDLSPILPPEISEGPHRSYAWQWMIFAIMTISGYLILVRKELLLHHKIDTEK
mgnify:CR=1 FL=1